jgi:aromatic-amino-acid transaminase
VVATLSERGLIPFSTSPTRASAKASTRTARSVRLCLEAGLEFFVATSFSKSFSLNGERVGALSVVCATRDAAARVLSSSSASSAPTTPTRPTTAPRRWRTCSRRLSLRALWEKELAGMRDRIRRMRLRVAAQAVAAGARDRDRLHHRATGHVQLSRASTRRRCSGLRERHGVYGLDSGRICVAALNEGNLPRVVEAITAVTKESP